MDKLRVVLSLAHRNVTREEKKREREKERKREREREREKKRERERKFAHILEGLPPPQHL